MYLTKFEYKKVKNKLQWVCVDSYGFVDDKYMPTMVANKGVIALGLLRKVYAFTPNRVNLGSCKRPHHYIWSKS
jgi:hypothetical protein